VLGREVCAVLRRRGAAVVALARRRDAVTPSSAGEVRIADLLSAEPLAGVLGGVTHVISCVGASVELGRGGRKSYDRVDVPANAALIAASAVANVQRFVYISVRGADSLPHLRYFAAHGRVEQALRGSGLAHAILRPTGFFSAMGQILDMARIGIVPRFGSGAAHTNPIHEADVAEACVDALGLDAASESGSDGVATRGAPGERAAVVRELGGPETFSRRAIAELAFAALGSQARFIPMPTLLMRMNIALLRPLHPRMADLMAFVLHVMRHETVAPAYGTRRLADYFRERAAATSARSIS
ncbi:MAG: SDR family oxidoreductase, partial [Phycisphaerae bacterium]